MTVALVDRKGHGLSLGRRQGPACDREHTGKYGNGQHHRGPGERVDRGALLLGISGRHYGWILPELNVTRRRLALDGASTHSLCIGRFTGSRYALWLTQPQ